MSSFPAPVLPMCRSFTGCVVVAFAHRAALIVVTGQEATHHKHRDFFHAARTYLPRDRDAYLLVNSEGAQVWTQAHTERTAAGWQHGMVGMSPDQAAMVRRKAAAPLKPSAPQEPCDVGLFGDSPRQLDLVTLANSARKS